MMDFSFVILSPLRGLTGFLFFCRQGFHCISPPACYSFAPSGLLPAGVQCRCRRSLTYGYYSLVPSGRGWQPLCVTASDTRSSPFVSDLWKICFLFEMQDFASLHSFALSVTFLALKPLKTKVFRVTYNLGFFTLQRYGYIWEPDDYGVTNWLTFCNKMIDKTSTYNWQDFIV